MASGFQQRFKGKIAAALIYLRGNLQAGVFTNAGTPTNGTNGTLAGTANPGDLLVDTTNKVLYQNTNTLLSPTWTIFESSGGTGSFSNVTLTGLLTESAANAITAGTTRTQAGATALTKEVNRVDTSTAPAAGAVLGDGVSLPLAAAGLSIMVWNNTANPIQVYGAGTDTINGVATATGIAQPPNSIDVYVCGATAPAGTWAVEAGIGFAGALETVLAVDSVAAAGANQAAATVLPAAFNRVTTATLNQGVKLPAAQPGLNIIVANHTGVPIIVYGNGSDTVDDVAGATGVVMMNRSVVIFTCYSSSTGWLTNGLATGYASNAQGTSALETVQFADGISAAGASQAAATQLTAAISTVSTVGAGTGVNLPASAAGLSVVVINAGANPLLVYPAQGASDTINGVAATVGVSLFPGTAAVFNCTLAGAWTTQPGTTKNDAFNTASNTTSFTASAANVTGGASVVALALTGALGSGQNITLPSAANVVAALHSPTIGTSFRLRIINESSGAFAWTVVQGSGNTLTGTATINQNTWREYVVTVTAIGTPAVTYQNVGTGTFS